MADPNTEISLQIIDDDDEATTNGTTDTTEDSVLEPADEEAENPFKTNIFEKVELTTETNDVKGVVVCSPTNKNCGDNVWIYGGIAATIVVIGIIVAFAKKCKSGKCVGKPGEKSRSGASRPSGSHGGKLVEIYVGNLSYDVDDALLLKQFTKFGVIKSARVVINRHNNKSKGYGFVEMPHREEAEIAIKKLNNHDLLGRPMKVNEARRDSRPPERR